MKDEIKPIHNINKYLSGNELDNYVEKHNKEIFKKDNINKEVKMKKSIFDNKIMNRNFIDWSCLVFSVLNLLIVFSYYNNYGRLGFLQMFSVWASGICFAAWLFSGIINVIFEQAKRNINICEQSLKLNRKLGEENKNLFLELQYIKLKRRRR